MQGYLKGTRNMSSGRLEVCRQTNKSSVSSRQDGKINRCLDVRRDDVRGQKTRGQLLLLARLRGLKQSSDNLPHTYLPARLSVLRFLTGVALDLEDTPRCWTGVPLFTNGEAHYWSV
jgi:hypothetical protein